MPTIDSFQMFGVQIWAQMISALVKGSRTPAAARTTPHTQAAGVREASGEETAGRVRSVVPHAIGIVAFPIVARRAGAAESGQRDAVADVAVTNLDPYPGNWRSERDVPAS